MGIYCLLMKLLCVTLTLATNSNISRHILYTKLVGKCYYRWSRRHI